MERAVIVRGRMSDPRHIELDEPVGSIRGEVEVVVKSAAETQRAAEQDVFDFIARLPPGARSKADIDRQVREEREAWGRS